MTTYIHVLVAGTLIGALYALLHIRSPAPPPTALAGLAAMLIGATW
ncbi:DUF1427 family protein [Cryobacterium adonitolivorans]|uniref:DUF1427 family protein n=1 Tax=Cryobacterium adonitolivorans TaxID=1259189 RepID=A0A4R8W801_9MICO|nr:DUF1427 family protein [Cryobacterium adonitolivorans]